MTAPPALSPRDAVAHLTPEHWARVGRLLIRKALAEFTHERLLTPTRLSGDEHPSGGRFTVPGDDGATEYRFAARKLSLDHWQIDADSITRHRDGGQLPLDALAFITELRGSLGRATRSCPSIWRRSAPHWPAPPSNWPPRM